MRALRNYFSVLIIVLLLAVTVSAQTQELPKSDWYAVIWARSEDTLHWVNANGEPASIERPKLPDEALNANPQMRFSRDGRYMVLVAELQSGLNGIGIYDIQAGQFTQTHQAQPDEVIYLGRDHTTNLSATQMVVGFASSDFEDTSWRIIIFDLATGASVDLLDAESATWEMDIPPSIPVVTYYDVDESIGQEVIHFQMIPKLQTPTEIVPAFKWYPALDPPADMGLSPYMYLDAEINYLTGEVIRPYVDPNFPSLPAPESGLNYNAIGRAIPTLEDIAPTAIWVDAERYLYSPVWANSNNWVAFFTEAGAESVIAGWQIAPRDGLLTDKSLTPLPASAREVFGTPDGVLMIDVDNRVFHITSLDAVEGRLLYQAPETQLTQILFVTREAGSFLLANVAPPSNAPVVVAPSPASGQPTALPVSGETIVCEGSLPTRLQIGARAQVGNTDGIPLRMREVPGGNVVTEIAEGTGFDILGGPECFDGYTWWQIQIESGVTGWSAEGDNEDYWMNVISTPAPVVVATDVPTVEAVIDTTTSNETETNNEGVPLAERTEEAVVTENLVGDGNCEASPEPRVTVGINVIVQAAGGTLAFRANPLDNAPVAQLPDQTVLPVVGGPACRTGYRQWQVRANIDGVLRDGWVSEGTVTRYFLEPSQ